MTDWLTEMENVCHEWSAELIPDRSECKSLFELKLFSPFVVFMSFLVFSFWYLEILVFIFLSVFLFSHFFLRFGCNHTRPSKLVKQVFSFCLPCLTHSLASHPCPQRVHLFSPADKKRGVRFLSATSPAKDHYLVSDSPPPFCSSLYPLHPPSLFASSSHPSVSFGFRRFQRGGGERERWNQRWIRQRDGFGWKARL